MNLARTIEPVGLSVLLLLLLAPVAVAMAGNNVFASTVVILTDDMGCGDIGAYVYTQIDTPHIHAIAQRRVLLINGYAISDARATLIIYLKPLKHFHGITAWISHQKAVYWGIFVFLEMFDEGGALVGLKTRVPGIYFFCDDAQHDGIVGLRFVKVAFAFLDQTNLGNHDQPQV